MNRPPALAQALLRHLADPVRRDAMLGDLDEEFHDHVVPERGLRQARLWYWRQALKSLPPSLAQRLRRGRANRKRATRGDGFMETLLRDLRFSLRSFAKNRAFTAVIILTLALGIGANTIIYSVVDGVILHPFPFPDQDRLVAVGTEYPALGSSLNFIEHISPAEYVDIRDESRTLQDAVAWDMGNRQVSFGDVTENLFSGFWWGDAFKTLGVTAHRGRGFTWEETVTDERVAILSHRVWQTRFGADPSLVGGTIVMNGNPYTVIGIMPPGTLIFGTDLWLPMTVEPERFPRQRRQWQVMARIRPGATLEEVNTELGGLARRTEQEYVAEFEEYDGWNMRAMTWTASTVRTLKPAAFILLGAVGFVLLLVCSNVGSLLLARTTARRREMAVRTAMGAGRGRLVRQLLTESVALAGLGGAIGVGLAYFGTREVGDIISTVPFVAGSVALNTRVLVFTALVSVGAGILFGLFPALLVSGESVQDTLKSAGTATTGGRGHLRLQRMFVVVEVALALLLLVGGGLLLNSFLRLQAVDPGFDSENVLTMRLTLSREEYDGPAVNAFFQELQDRVGGLPGVQDVAIGSQFPPIVFSRNQIAVEGQEVTEEGQLPTAYTTLASPGYFATLGIPLRRGRTFTALDVEGSPLVTVINEAAAQMFFPDQDPIGQRLRLGAAQEAPWFEVAGVVGSVRNRGLDADLAPEIYASHRQLSGVNNQLFVIARTAVEPRSVLPAVRAEVKAMDPDQPIYAIRTIEEAFASGTAPRRVLAAVLGAFAAFALLLAAVGIYSVVSFAVGERTREIGLRVALGAEAGQVQSLMVRQALGPVLLGTVIGLVGALAIGRLMEQILFQVSARDPLTLGLVAVVLGLVALSASYVPAARASRLDPVKALRYD